MVHFTDRQEIKYHLWFTLRKKLASEFHLKKNKRKSKEF